MKIDVYRYSSQSQTTQSLIHINKRYFCDGLEDKHRVKKVWGETRIPSGVYEVALRTEGGTHKRYKKRFPRMHQGMLHILNVPNFEWILIHIGNDKEDTAGCLLVGEKASDNRFKKGLLKNSTDTYIQFYLEVMDAIKAEEKVFIEFHDLDNPI